MSWYAKQYDTWTEQSSPPSSAPSIQVQAKEEHPPDVRFLENGHEFFHLSGADPLPTTDTIHTVAAIDFEAVEGHPLFAVHVDDDTLTFEDLRAPGCPADYGDDLLDQAQSALSEILIPVYIDDVVRDISEGLPGLVILHTAQYGGSGAASWTYFRTSTFADGTLVLEEEHGAI